MPCSALLCLAGQETHCLVDLLAVSFLVLSRISVANTSKVKPITTGGKPGLAERGEVSWLHKPTKHATKLLISVTAHKFY
jgi:hypothetical protein